jgi:hypothetical protein
MKESGKERQRENTQQSAVSIHPQHIVNPGQFILSSRFSVKTGWKNGP